MKRRNKMLLILAAAIGMLALAKVSWGQEQSNYSLELLMGVTDYDKDALFLEDGVAIESNATRMLSQHFGVTAGGSVGFTETDLEAFRPCESCAGIADQTGMDVTVWEAHAGLRAYLVSQSARVRPYVEGGFGWYRFYSDAEDYDEKGAWQIRAVAGLQARLQRDVGLAVTFGYNPLQCDLFDRTAQADVISAKVGITYNPGWERKKERPVVVETPPAETVEYECVTPRSLDSIQIYGRTYEKWKAPFTPSDGVAWREVGDTIMRYPIYVYAGAEQPYSSIFVEVCPGEFQEYRTEIQATTG